MKPSEPGLGRGAGRNAGRGVGRHARGNEHDAPVRALAEAGIFGRGEDCRAQVQREGAVDRFAGEVHRQALAAAAGVEHENVERAVNCVRRANHIAGSLARGEIAHDDVAADFGGDRLGAFRFGAGVDHDSRPVRRQPPRDRRADPARGAGDEGGSSLETHIGSPQA